MLKKHYKADKESFVLIINNHHTNWMIRMVYILVVNLKKKY